MTDEAPGPDELADTQPVVVVPPDAPWIAVARKYIGTLERVGEADNPLIVAWLGAVGLPAQHDETPWCSAFANACMREAGFEGSGKANARSWLSWGLALTDPRPGCVVVFNRPPTPASGHVAFYVGPGDEERTIKVLGGNQHNRVCTADYPMRRLLGYRWPAP